MTAGLHPTLTAHTSTTHPYYIQTEKSEYAVGDGGDFLDLLLPPELRKRWAERVTQEHVDALVLASEGKWEGDSVEVGQEVTLNGMATIQYVLNRISKGNVLVGNIFKKEEE